MKCTPYIRVKVRKREKNRGCLGLGLANPESRHDSNYWWLITILSAPDYTPYVSTYHTYHTHSRQYQNLPHVFLHTGRTILYLIKQYLAFLCSFVFSYFASFLFHIMCLCILCICILILSGPGYAQYISTTGLPPVPIVPFPAFERHYKNLHSRFHIITGATAVSWRKL